MTRSSFFLTLFLSPSFLYFSLYKRVSSQAISPINNLYIQVI